MGQKLKYVLNFFHNLGMIFHALKLSNLLFVNNDPTIRSSFVLTDPKSKTPVFSSVDMNRLRWT